MNLRSGNHYIVEIGKNRKSGRQVAPDLKQRFFLPPHIYKMMYNFQKENKKRILQL